MNFNEDENRLGFFKRMTMKQGVLIGVGEQKVPERTNAQNNYRVATEVLVLNVKVDKILEERKHGHRNQFRVRESVMQGESINTYHIHCT